jgi:hypothetical protein
LSNPSQKYPQPHPLHY